MNTLHHVKKIRCNSVGQVFGQHYILMTVQCVQQRVVRVSGTAKYCHIPITTEEMLCENVYIHSEINHTAY